MTTSAPEKVTPRKLTLRRATRGLLVAGLILGGLYYLAARNGGTGRLQVHEVRRTPLGDGTEMLQARLYRNWVSAAGQLVIVYLDPAKVDLQILRNPDRLKLAELAPNAQLVMNGGYFTPEFRPTGLLVSRGVELSPFISTGGPAGSGVLVVEDGQVELIRREDVRERTFENADIAIQAGPRLIEPDGTRGIHSDDRHHANRTFIGADARGWLVLGVVYRGDGGVGGGPSLFELQRLLLKLGPPVTRITFALNLDGGPSTGLHLRVQPELNLSESGTVFSAVTVRAHWP